MQVSVTFRRIEPSENLKDYATEKISRVQKYLDTPAEAHVVLSVEKFRHIAEVSINVNGVKINGVEETEDMYSAIDMVADKLETQVRKYKTKFRRRKSGPDVKSRMLNMDIIESPGFDEVSQPRVIKSETFYAKPMDVDEAVMQLDLSNNEFLVFTNAHTNNISVLYKRKDGNYGLIEP